MKNVKKRFTSMGRGGRERRGRREFVLCPREKKENSARMFVTADQCMALEKITADQLKSQK